MPIGYCEVMVDAAGLRLANIRQLKKLAAEEGVCRRQRTVSKVQSELANYPGVFHGDLPRRGIISAMHLCTARAF